jgi:broad specificity phosphatase PhoE
MTITKQTELFLIRHGQTDSNVNGLLHGSTDVPLNDLGRQQAIRVAERIHEMGGFTTLYASPLQRARLTAEAIAKKTGLSLTLHEGLAEMSFGSAEGVPFRDVPELYPEIYARLNDLEDYDVRFPDGESRFEFATRVRNAFDDIIAREPGNRVIVVAHGGVIAAATAMLLGETIGDFRRYSIANCSVTHFEISTSGPVAHLISDTVHLETLEVEVEVPVRQGRS